MSGDRVEQFERLMNAHLDGRLTDVEAAEFRRLIDGDADLRAEFELQSGIDTSLRRLFGPDRAAGQAGANGTLSQSERVISLASVDAAAHVAPVIRGSRTSRPRRRALWAAMAAAIALSALAVYRTWPAREPNYIWNELQLTQHSAEAFYRVLEKQDFNTDWECNDDRDFAAFVHRRLKHGLVLAKAPPGVQILGLTHGWTLSRKSVHLTAKVDGRGVIVFGDRLDNPDRIAPSPTPQLRVFERHTDRFVLYEVTPLDEPRLLDLFKEVEVPEEWLKRGYGGISGGRIRKDDPPAPAPEN